MQKLFKHRLSVIVIIIIFTLTLGVTVARAATLNVDQNDGSCSDVGGTPYCTLQAAISDASAGDTINIAAGTYYEVGQIIIDKDLTIIGADRDTVIIKPDHDTNTASYTATTGWWYITSGTTFSLSGVTLDGTDLAGAHRTIHTAIQSRGVSEISDCKIQNIKSHKYIGFGIQFLDNSGNLVENCEMSNIYRVGIHVRGGSSAVPTGAPNADIIDFTYTGKGAGDYLDYGVEFGGGGTGTVFRATITNNTGVAASDNSNSAGILATDYYGTGTNASVNNSDLTGNSIGIIVGYLPADTTVFTAANNNISGNTTHGIYNNGALMTLAENNWWGSSDGPVDADGSIEVDGTNCTRTPEDEVNADGIGNAVTDLVDYCPWLSTAPSDPTVIFGGVNSNQDTGDSVLAEAEIAVVGITQLFVTFSEQMDDETPGDQASNTENFRLITEGSVPGIETDSCELTSANDAEVTIVSASYDDSTFTTTLNLAGDLPNGLYRLFACGSSTLRDTVFNPLNGGIDFIRNFEVQVPAEVAAFGLPVTGFPQGVSTILPEQPADSAYASTEMLLSIPALNKELSIVGVPKTNAGWDVSWLGNNAGYLSGSAYPTWAGNTVITSHVWDANNSPGPFANLKDLNYGDQFTISAYGQTYTYEVRSNSFVWPNQTEKVFEHQEFDWVTLLTCEFYNPFTDNYLFRRMVQAVLVNIN